MYKRGEWLVIGIVVAQVWLLSELWSAYNGGVLGSTTRGILQFYFGFMIGGGLVQMVSVWMLARIAQPGNPAFEAVKDAVKDAISKENEIIANRGAISSLCSDWFSPFMTSGLLVLGWMTGMYLTLIAATALVLGLVASHYRDVILKRADCYE
jgi:hypothetical protein